MVEGAARLTGGTEPADVGGHRVAAGRTDGSADHAAGWGPGRCVCGAGDRSGSGGVGEMVPGAAGADFVLGRGSNLLVRDGGIRGVVICLAQPAFTEVGWRGSGCGAARGRSLKRWRRRRGGRGWRVWNFWRAFRAAWVGRCA
jgi:hypothetical protein